MCFRTNCITPAVSHRHLRSVPNSGGRNCSCEVLLTEPCMTALLGLATPRLVLQHITFYGPARRALSSRGRLSLWFVGPQLAELWPWTSEPEWKTVSFVGFRRVAGCIQRGVRLIEPGRRNHAHAQHHPATFCSSSTVNISEGCLPA